MRLVVDTGIHDLGAGPASRPSDYFKIHSPQTLIAGKADRYISWPAQALSYKMGELRIRALKAKAEQQLGAKFDIRDFNDAVIRDGRLPLDILSGQIDQFIAQARQHFSQAICGRQLTPWWHRLQPVGRSALALRMTTLGSALALRTTIPEQRANISNCSPT